MLQRFLIRVRSGPLVLAVMVVAGIGCQNEPIGRIETSQTTRAEKASTQVLPIAYSEFSDQAAQEVVQGLLSDPDIQAMPGKVTVIVGDIENNARSVSTREFEYLISRFRSNLIRSSAARAKLRFVEGRRRMQRLADREGVIDPNTGGVAQPEGYRGDTALFLNGTMQQVYRGPTNEYFLEMQLTNPLSNEILWTSVYNIKQTTQSKL